MEVKMKNLFSVNAYSDDDGLLPELKATEARNRRGLESAKNCYLFWFVCLRTDHLPVDVSCYIF